ncbi:MAG TPA: DUF4394 domain-containing protein [Xanthomonadales bacterium]|nr:DUF4394 domain-containing protein [Xanthomonadales bacterium]
MRAAASCLAFVLAAVAAPAAAVDAIVATSTNGLLRFDTGTPGVATVLTISGIGAGDAIVGMDVRPIDRQVYLVTRNPSGAGRLYRLNPDTGIAVQLSTLTADPADVTAPYTQLTGLRYGVDFNPVADRLRLVGDTRQNLRVNPANGLVTTDSDLNPGVPVVVASGYTESYAGAALTTLYGIDVVSDTLYFQNPPNNGTLVPVGVLGGAAGDVIDTATLDIGDAPARNSAFAVLTSNDTARVYAINLSTGAATPTGGLAGNPVVSGFAILDPGVVFRNGFE